MSKLFEDLGEDSLVKDIQSLAEIVYWRHFSGFARDQEDLISEGVLKAITLLKNGVFDSSRSSMKNYLYTGMRNEMQNYLYRNKKEVLVGLEVRSEANEFVSIEIPWCVVEKVVKRFYTRWQRPALMVVEKLREMGLEIKGRPPRRIQGPELQDEMLGRLVCLTVWSWRDCCL